MDDQTQSQNGKPESENKDVITEEIKDAPAVHDTALVGPTDDLELIYLKTPNPSAHRGEQVVLHNKNIAEGIIATMRVNGSDNFLVFDVSLRYEDYFPHEFEVRLPPGGCRYLGQSILAKMLKADIHVPPESIQVSYTIVGARYVKDEPTPLPSVGKLSDYIRFYHIDFMNGSQSDSLIYSLNKNHVYGINATLEWLPAHPEYMSVDLIPFQSKLNAQRPMSWATGLSIRSGQFFEYTCPLTLAVLLKRASAES
ncbi:hypothetical protein [Paraburkholderia fungorum]|uniref:hypothetical protein n=1 Tax=Paraburkholderia fungorum TaxID=134537 RepID=UPI0020939D5A|nr:hypothetical protein [Paraburkholderia fungorum]USU18834.1 hypothetical protein NFE55_32280 [Paraburkholderia fungorum]USU29170.1 hypothetical protein NFS19_29290 [Paraburkholderia fungorum]